MESRVYLSGGGLYVSIDAKPEVGVSYFIVGDTHSDLPSVGMFISDEKGAEIRAFINACNARKEGQNANER